MKNRISNLLEDSPESRKQQNDETHRVDEILGELLGQYQRHFPHIRIAVVETPVTVI